MHSYLRAIGFSNINSRKQLEQVYYHTLREPNRKIATTIRIDTSLIQYEKDFAPATGLALLGEYDSNGSLSIEHYYPYVKGDEYLEYESISIEKQTDKESYAGICEDYRLGMTLIFYVINIADYAKSKWFNYSDRPITQVKFSGLSTNGTILLGVSHSANDLRREKQNSDTRKKLLEAAKDGNHQAIDNLTTAEMNTYSSLYNRVQSEDLLSIVDTSFMPCGVECDHYMIIGNIQKVSTLTNASSKETLYNMLVETNDITLNVCINQKDLQGEPMEGRRFRGEIWLQGVIRI